jgi:hypothetical protein
MGNLTPRILRCINMLNVQMGATGAKSALRRVHHNAESHRNHIFGALTATQMDGGDGFPLTVFQPRALLAPNSPVRVYEGRVHARDHDGVQAIRDAAQRGRLLRAEELDVGNVDSRSLPVGRRAAAA